MVVVGHRTHRAILYPIAALPGGKVLINWLAYTKIPSRARRRSKPGIRSPTRALRSRRYGGWSYPWLDVQGLFARTERVLQLPNVDRDPIPRWSFCRVTLIGDAAHPMQPVGAQAGSQAIVDGRVLAASLLASADPAEALVALPGPADRRDERHDHPQPQSRPGNGAADRRRARARRI